MCELRTKLIPWLDGELAADEAAQVEEHLTGCGECRNQLAAYKKVNAAFDAYCDAVMLAESESAPTRWMPTSAGIVAAIALAAVAVTLILLTRVQPTIVTLPTVAVVSDVTASPATEHDVSRKSVQRQKKLLPVQEQAPTWQPADAEIQIAIPADAMFPPGAVPEGISFVAEMTISPEGSVRQVRLQQ